jgi:hypothetical protein
VRAWLSVAAWFGSNPSSCRECDRIQLFELLEGLVPGFWSEAHYAVLRAQVLRYISTLR